jgi:hypothetical protein
MFPNYFNKNLFRRNQDFKKISGGGDKIHPNKPNAIAKLFQMKVLIVPFVIKVMEYVKKE